MYRPLTGNGNDVWRCVKLCVAVFVVSETARLLSVADSKIWQNFVVTLCPLGTQSTSCARLVSLTATEIAIERNPSAQSHISNRRFIYLFVAAVLFYVLQMKYMQNAIIQKSIQPFTVCIDSEDSVCLRSNIPQFKWIETIIFIWGGGGRGGEIPNGNVIYNMCISIWLETMNKCESFELCMNTGAHEPYNCH